MSASATAFAESGHSGATEPAVARAPAVRSRNQQGPGWWGAASGQLTVLGEHGGNLSVGGDGHGGVLITDPAASSSVVQMCSTPRSS